MGCMAGCGGVERRAGEAQDRGGHRRRRQQALSAPSVGEMVWRLVSPTQWKDYAIKKVDWSRGGVA